VRLEGADHAYAVAVGGTEDVVPDGDEGEPILAVEELAAACGARDLTPPQVFSKEMLKRCPRVDGPKIRDKPGDAIREDTPGYIVCAFPKLFPFGSGDFHSARGNLRSKFEFSEWGRYVMQWHDGRFMRHNRFRYWFLNTWLRMKTPGLRELFWRVTSGAAELTIEDLATAKQRKKLVQQMSTSAANLPGSVGERRTMRQYLEALVDQKEMETAEHEMHGRGRLPAGFCTFTCPVYKWQQLHDLLLSTYTANERERFGEWRYAAKEEQDSKKRDVYYLLANSNPGAVAWYCALRLEATVHLAVATLTVSLQGDVVPGRLAAAAALEQKLTAA
jgi:hypothetical protein